MRPTNTSIVSVIRKAGLWTRKRTRKLAHPERGSLSFRVFFWFGYLGHPTAQRNHVDCNQLHSRTMTASSDSTHDCLLLFLLGGRRRSSLEPTYQSRIVERVTCSLPLGRSISPPLLYKNKKKKKKKLCAKTIASDLIDFFP